ncbi:MAG: hypothetical protein Q7S00_02590, partial [bacterium]|nr:hypothetical protein [bacterium]
KQPSQSLTDNGGMSLSVYNLLHQTVETAASGQDARLVGDNHLTIGEWDPVIKDELLKDWETGVVELNRFLREALTHPEWRFDEEVLERCARNTDHGVDGEAVEKLQERGAAQVYDSTSTTAPSVGREEKIRTLRKVMEALRPYYNSIAGYIAKGSALVFKENGLSVQGNGSALVIRGNNLDGDLSRFYGTTTPLSNLCLDGRYTMAAFGLPSSEMNQRIIFMVTFDDDPTIFLGETYGNAIEIAKGKKPLTLIKSAIDFDGDGQVGESNWVCTFFLHIPFPLEDTAYTPLAGETMTLANLDSGDQSKAQEVMDDLIAAIFSQVEPCDGTYNRIPYDLATQVLNLWYPAAPTPDNTEVKVPLD